MPLCFSLFESQSPVRLTNGSGTFSKSEFLVHVPYGAENTLSLVTAKEAFMRPISRTLRISVASILTVALLTIPTRSPAQSNETPQQRAERQREEAEQRAERQRQAEERAERQREAEERAERQREAQERAERQREAQERAEQQRQAQERAQQQREAQERAEQQRQAQERAQQQREAQERAEQQRQTQERAQQQREAQEQAQQHQRQVQEQQQRESTPRPSTPAYASRPSPTRTEQPHSETRQPATSSSTSGGTTVVVRPVAPQPNSSRSPVSPATTGMPVHSNIRPTYAIPPTASVVAHTPGGGSTLDAAGSQGILHDLNQNRSHLGGLNAKPLPAGSITLHENGNATLQTTSGTRYGLRPNGAISSYASHGTMVTFRPNGKVRSVHTPTMEIQRGVHGERTIKTFRKDGTVLVSTGSRAGYLEHQAVYQGHTVVVRTYFSAGRTYNRTMVTNFYGVVALPRYVPAVYYAPAFYGWLYYPWAMPVSYSWAWTGQPWFASAQDYFSPDPQYPSGFAWLADYFLAKVLANGYADKTTGSAADLDPGPTQGYEDAYAQQDTPITPAVKAEIAEEVQRQIAIESAAATGAAQPAALELPAAMKPNRIFVASSSVDLLTSDQQTCAVSAGDVLKLENPATEQEPMATLRVQTSRQGECPAGELVSVGVQDMQEWQNEMRAQIDAGMAEMRTLQGQKGLPAAPSDAVAPPPRPSMPSLTATGLEQNVGSLLDAQQREARQAETAAVAPLLSANQ